jgi:CO/xanthine dehydrogenase Mo-binding subunit
MVIEIESGVKKDGTITARRGRLIIDNGAYTADSAFFSQLAAMHIHGPYKTQSASIDAHCVYTNHQPSGSVRAPTAPQACWALEQHTDELAAAIGMDPVEFRRKNCIDTGDEGPTRQVYLPIGLHECIANAVEMSGYGQELPEDEAIGLAVGWWPTFGVPSGAYVKLNADGSGVIVTGAQECGTGSVMTLPMLAADELGMQPEDFTLVYQDTDAGPWDMGATGSQTLVNNGRAVVAAAKQVADQLRQLAADQMEASPEDIELVDGFAQVKGSPDSRVAVAELAEAAHGGELLLGTGSGTPPAGPETDNQNCVGKLGMDAWSAPQVSCHAVRVKLDRDTGVVRVLDVSCSHDSGTIINETGAEGQVEGGVMMGMGQALSEGTKYDDEGRQLNAALLEYKLQTMPDAPPIAVKWVQTNASDGGPRGSKGVAEAPNVATAAAIANALSKLTGGPLRKMPMTPERVWEHTQEMGS